MVTGALVKRYLLKEYGSWGVMVLSYLAGLLVSGGATPRAIPAFVALALAVNSKQALTAWIRSAGPASRVPMVIFIVQVVTASGLLVWLLSADLVRFLPYAAVPCAYLVLLRYAGEHALLTEVSGFILLSTSVLISRYVLSGEIDPRLFIAVAVFFAAGVFKVRAKLRKGIFERSLAVLYVVGALVVYHLIGVPLVVLLPLADNLIFSASLYRVTLKTAGWLEVAKGAAFLVLLTFNYPPLRTALIAYLR